VRLGVDFGAEDARADHRHAELVRFLNAFLENPWRHPNEIEIGDPFLRKKPREKCLAWLKVACLRQSFVNRLGLACRDEPTDLVRIVGDDGAGNFKADLAGDEQLSRL
jgi:hypothetical protein